MISLIAFITALSGFLNEMNLAQTLTATMGGTALRYQMTFGIFTFSLGFGAWLFDQPFVKKYSSRHILLLSQVVMVPLSLGSPFWITLLNPLKHPEAPLYFQLLCHLPIVLTGLVTGFELPALLSWATTTPQKRYSPLAWDYVGMFVASFAFPFYFLYSLGVYGTALATAALAILAFALVVCFCPASQISTQTRLYPKPATPLFILSLIFLLSFCSFSYELILAKILGDILRDETLAYSLGVGIMLVGLGVGTYQAQNIKSPLKTLSFVEMGLVTIGSLTFVTFYFVATCVYAIPALHFISESKWLAVSVFSPLPFAMGWLTGFELPLLLKVIDKDNSSLGVPLALNYLGALLSGLAVPLLILPITTPALAIKAIACLNFLLLCLLLLKTTSLGTWKKFATAAISCSALVLVTKLNPAAEQLFLKTYYYDLSVSNMSLQSIENFFVMTQAVAPVQRETTMYQFIDKVKDSRTDSFFAREGFVLFLNKQQQVDSANWNTYHESFAMGASLAPETKLSSVLICGGGDGLLARVLLEQHPSIKIDLIELDPRMIELSKTDADMLDVNNDALSDPRVNVQVDDAYARILRETKTYDAIYLDFPYPDTFELSRLYSLELYRGLLAHLNPGGFIVFDAPIWRYIDRDQVNAASELQILTDTLKAAGFKTVFPFGTFEPFIFASPEERAVEFSEDALKDVSNSAYANLIGLRFLYTSDPTKPLVNSIFRPQPFLKQ